MAPDGEAAPTGATWPVHAGLLLVAAIWGGSWASGRDLVSTTDPLVAAVLRYSLAVPLFALWLWWFEHDRRWRWPTRADWGPFWLIAVLGTVCYQLLFMLGMTLTGAADASVIITVNPLFTALQAQLVLKERLDSRLLTGLALGLAGVVVVTGWSPNSDIPLEDRLLGDALILTAAFCWAWSSVLIQRMRRVAPQHSGLAVMAWGSMLGWLILIPFGVGSIMLHGWTNPSPRSWAHIVYLGVLSTVVTHLLFAWGIQRLTARRAALYVYLVPVFGVLIAWLWLDEALGWAWPVGLLLIFGGVHLARQVKAKEAVPTATDVPAADGR